MFIEVLTAFSRTEFVIYKLFSTSRIGLFWPMLQSTQAVRKINTVRIPTDFFWKTSWENYNGVCLSKIMFQYINIQFNANVLLLS